MIGYEHIEVCYKCKERYLEPLPKAKGPKVRTHYICPKCLLASDVADDIADLLAKIKGHDL